MAIGIPHEVDHIVQLVGKTKAGEHVICGLHLPGNLRAIAKSPNRPPEILAAVDDLGSAGRAVYHPEDDNDAHAGIYGIAPDEAQLLARLANEVWCGFLTKDAADALPEGGCAKSANVV